MLPTGTASEGELVRRERGVGVLRGFQAGGRVERTGLALVHEGEYVVPALGSEAIITPSSQGMSNGQVINFYFPVEVEIVGELGEAEMQRISRYVFEELVTALNSRI